MTAIDTLLAPASPARPLAGDRPPTWLVLAAEGRSVLWEPVPGQVAVVSVGALFIKLLHELRPSLAVLTVPPAGSTELLAAVAERRDRSGLRLVLLNEPTDVAGRLDALAQGFDEALPASIDPGELAGRIRLMLGGGRDPATKVRQVPIALDVVLDLVGQRVRRHGREIHLRPKEFALLALLATDPGRVFSRDELVDRVWGPAYGGGARTVDVHIRWLRAKIEADPGHPAHLITVRGTGYRLDPPQA